MQKFHWGLTQTFKPYLGHEPPLLPAMDIFLWASDKPGSLHEAFSKIFTQHKPSQKILI